MDEQVHTDNLKWILSHLFYLVLRKTKTLFFKILPRIFKDLCRRAKNRMFFQKLRPESTKNKPLFLIGSGPSLAKCDITKLKNCYTISFNRSYIAFHDWGFQPTYFAGLDKLVNEDNKEDYIKLIKHSQIKRFFFPTDTVTPHCFDSEKTTSIPIDYTDPLNPNLSFDERLKASNSGLFGLQIAIGLLGFKEIYLLGCDATYDDNLKGVKVKGGIYKGVENMDVNHFRSDYYGKGRTYSKPAANTWHLPAWRAFFEKELVSRDDVHVYNCSSKGALTFFEFRDFNEITKNIGQYEIEN